MFIVKLADLKIGIDNKYDFVESYCKSYRYLGEDFDFCVSVTEDEIDAEAALAELQVSRGVLESVCIYRSIAKHLPFYDAFVIHCAAIEFENRAFCFAAKSGIGKTTHISLWHGIFGDKVQYINGDKPIMRFIDNELYVYGTPWSGKEKYNRNTKAPLKDICFLNQASENSICKLTEHEALSRCLKQVYIPQNAIAAEKTIDLIGKLLEGRSVWLLNCNISKEAVMIAYEAMK